MDKKELKAITVVKEGKLTAIASTEDEDRAGDSLKVKDWNFDLFLKNPVLQAGHDYRPQFTIGVAKNLRVEGKKVLFEPIFHEITPLAKQIKQMYEQGILKAWSVGFIPAEMTKDKRHELLEVSAVAVPANAHALMKTMKSLDKGQENQIALELKEWVEGQTHEDDTEVVEEGIDIVEEETPTDEENVVETPEENVEGEEKKYGKKRPKKKAVDEALIEEHMNLLVEDITKAVETHKGHLIGDDMEEAEDTSKSFGIEKEIVKGTAKDFAPWNPQFSQVFSKEFDVNTVKADMVQFEIDVYTKFFECEVKDIFLNSYMIPGAMTGNYLAGFEKVMEDYELVDVRNWSFSGAEFPPIYEIIKLNSKQEREFLVEGTKFYKVGGKNTLIVKTEPTWVGLKVDIISTLNKKDWNKELLTKVHRWVDENNYLKGEKFALSGEFIPQTGKNWDDIFVKDEIRDSVMKSMKVLDDVEKSRGLLFIGPPGTGKTMTGKVLMNQLDSTFIWISSKDMDRVGPVYAIKMAYNLARRLAPTILFVEDVDNWLYGYPTDLLKTELDGVQENKGVVTILTSNYPEKLPDALLDRPGRFHEIINYDLPEKTQRLAMIKAWADGVSEERAEDIADRTEGYSGAHIKELVEFSKMIAQDDDVDIDMALEKGYDKLEKQRALIHDIKRTRHSKGVDEDVEIVMKEGRVISKATRKKLEIARDSIDDVLAIDKGEQGQEEVEDAEEKVMKEVEKMFGKTVKVVEESEIPEEVLTKALQHIVKVGNLTLHQRRKSRQSK